MRKTILTIALAISTSVMGQTDVTSKYIANPEFGARFAAWENAGNFTFNAGSGFTKKKGEVFMEKWVAKGNKLSSNSGMYQQLADLPVGTYTLVAAGQHINQNSTSTTCTGAKLYAGNESTEIHEANDYKVVFTVATGKANVGIKLTNATGNWCCIDNFRLYSNGIVQDSLDLELDRLITEAEGVYQADGTTAAELQQAIDNLKALKGKGADGVQEAAKALERATLQFRVENATGTEPKVTTHPFVAMGTTIALGRLTVSGTSAERGFCWSKDPNPTILDNRSTLFYSNNGNIYHMDGLEPGTIYYVRAYARTSGYKVGYGEVVKIATLPKGQVSYSYDFAGDEETNNRINSATAETVWMYNNLSNIRGFYLQVHYSPGSGAGGGTADCSYGGWMRVSQNVPYQQTGTILHETNHGVGVGTTNEWYNNSNLRAETSRGLWLGPQATNMVRFFENSSTSTMTGDGTHMWPYGINGAQEDSYNPSNKALYYANILITHAMHQDGLICSTQVGFATPAYVFNQDDDTKYYIKCEDEECGSNTAYLGMTSTGALRSFEMSAAEAMSDDNYAWNITYDAKSSLYLFRNVATGKYITYSSGFKTVARSGNPTSADKFHLMPSRSNVVRGDFQATSYWVLSSSDHKALEGGTYNSNQQVYTTKSSSFDAANAASAQRWLFVTADQLQTLEAGALKSEVTGLKSLIDNIKAIVATEHCSNVEDKSTDDIDGDINSLITSIEGEADTYTSLKQASEANDTLNRALITFLSETVPLSEESPYNLTCFITNPSFDENTNGWSAEANHSNGVAEYYQKNFDINQTIQTKMPKGTYEVRAHAFQRPGGLDDIYQDYAVNGTDNANAILYAKTKSVKIKNILADAQSKKVHSDDKFITVDDANQYFPNTMASASAWFKKGWYENSVKVTTSTEATFKIGIKSTANSAGGYWCCFDDFRLYYYGGEKIETAIQTTEAVKAAQGPTYDLSGRTIQDQVKRGVYIRNGKKIVK